MPACPHTMRRTRESDGATVCCDCGKVFKPKKAKATDGLLFAVSWAIAWPVLWIWEASYGE